MRSEAEIPSPIPTSICWWGCPRPRSRRRNGGRRPLLAAATCLSSLACASRSSPEPTSRGGTGGRSAWSLFTAHQHAAPPRRGSSWSEQTVISPSVLIQDWISRWACVCACTAGSLRGSPYPCSYGRGSPHDQRRAGGGERRNRRVDVVSGLSAEPPTHSPASLECRNCPNSITVML